MIGIQFLYAPLFRPAALALLQQLLHLRTVVHFGIYQTGRRVNQTIGQTHLFDVFVQRLCLAANKSATSSSF